MKPTIIFVDGVPMWNDERGGVHLPTQFRSYLTAEHLPVPPIVVKQIAVPFEINGGQFAAGDYVETVNGRALRGISAAEFAKSWEIKGVA